LVDLLLNPEDGSETFLRNVGLSELQGTQPRRTYSWYQKLSKPLSPSEPPLRLTEYNTKMYITAERRVLEKLRSLLWCDYGSLTKCPVERWMPEGYENVFHDRRAKQ
jgi:hypothetical protein